MRHILIVEDEQPIRTILAKQIAQENFAVITADNGKTGLQTSLRNHPDLILLDLTLPIMDGVSMLKKLRQDTWGKDVPVMVLTNRDDSENISTMLNNKVNGYYIKADSKLEDIIREIKDLFQMSQKTPTSN